VAADAVDSSSARAAAARWLTTGGSDAWPPEGAVDQDRSLWPQLEQGSPPQMVSSEASSEFEEEAEDLVEQQVEQVHQDKEIQGELINIQLLVMEQVEVVEQEQPVVMVVVVLQEMVEQVQQIQLVDHQ
jgi:hypothetical protein